MERDFQYRRYAEENADLSARFGIDAKPELLNHYQRYGRFELRGTALGRHFRIDHFLLSDRGVVFLTGWADRRFLPEFRLDVEVGYMRYESVEFDIVWYERSDVNAATGDTQRPAGFFILLQLPEIVLHSRVRVFVNRYLALDEEETRWLSADQFLNQVLGSLVALADQPIGQSLDQGKKLAPIVQRYWSDVVSDMKFVCVFDGRSARPVERTIVIVLHRKSNLLLPQLQLMAAYLEQSATEVVIVGNELQAPQAVVTSLTAFSQLHDVQISLHLCSGNSGFSRANNFGAEIARGKTLIFMNPDVFPAQHDAKSSFAFLETDPGKALHGTLLYYGNGMLMHSGMYTAADIAFDARNGSAAPILRVEHFGKGLMHRIDDRESCPPPQASPVMASAALWKINKKTFDAFDGLSLNYVYAYYEDADFCMRLLEAKRDINIDHSARWFHMEGVGKAHPPYVRSFMWLNRVIYTQRFADKPNVADRLVDLTDL